jgi:L-ribulose-5-phosphate 4-epimerase
MLKKLKEKVCQANVKLYESGIVIYTFGNVSEIDRESGLVVIKPSGINYKIMKPEDMVIVDLKGNIIEGYLNPSVDTETHLVLYRTYEQIKSIAHTHSINATAFAQAGLPIPPLGTTHADYFCGEIPITRELTEQEVNQQYELNTGNVIVETIGNTDPNIIPGILVKNHGPFIWGKDAKNAVHNAVVLEQIAEMAYKTVFLNPNVKAIHDYFLAKHYNRKHGKNSYYGQKAKTL